MSLFTATALGPHTLQNRVVMAPMTRCRAIGGVPNGLMAEYYGQRASAGLIITEGVAPAPDGLGYARIPGLFSDEQIAGWRGVTEAAHKGGATIFAQIMHVGRVGHPLNMPEGAELVAPSAIAAAGQMWTDQEGMLAHPTPRAMTGQDLAAAQDSFVAAARNAVEAGFDGIELHAANGYLLEQFINPGTNQRTDGYGGSIEARGRFVVETARRAAEAIGAGRVGIRLSPYNTFNDMPEYDETDAQYLWLAEELGKLGLVYLHLVAPAGRIPKSLLDGMRKAFGGTVILNGGFDRARAEAAMAAGEADLVAFGAPFISNPDLPARLQSNTPLAQANPDLFYAAGTEGYTDYPAAA